MCVDYKKSDSQTKELKKAKNKKTITMEKEESKRKAQNNIQYSLFRKLDSLLLVLLL